MSDQRSGTDRVEDTVEDVKGKAKETAGAVTGRDDIKREGEAQQEKTDKREEAARQEARAEQAKAEAEAKEAEQRKHQ